MLDQLDAAHSVLVACTATYDRRFRGHGEPGSFARFTADRCAFTGETHHRLIDPQKQAEGGETSAQGDLDEAWEIAERGPMPLFLADIHLHRARPFHAVTPYPWTSPHADLAAARRLIEKHGYGRRKEELGDAEAAARNWPPSVSSPVEGRRA